MDDDRLFASGNPDPDKFGFAIRSSAGAFPQPERIEEVAARLGRPAFFVDDEGYECELFGGAVSTAGEIAYVESRAKQAGQHVDIAIRVHWIDSSGGHESADIESYNPFFGCDVRYFQWVGNTAMLIYREKHWTFACRFGDVWPPRFVKIEDRWIVHNLTLAFVGYKEQTVRRVTFPALEQLEPISLAEAERLGLLPPDLYG